MSATSCITGGLWLVKVTIDGGTPAVGTPAAISLRLEAATEDAIPPSLLMVIPSWGTAASLEPAMAEYHPSGDPVALVFTTHKQGSHDIHFRIYDHASGCLMQELKTVIEVDD